MLKPIILIFGISILAGALAGCAGDDSAYYGRDGYYYNHRHDDRKKPYDPNNIYTDLGRYDGRN